MACRLGLSIIHPPIAGSCDPRGALGPSYIVKLLGFLFFVPALLLSIFTLLFLPSSTGISYFVLAVEVHEFHISYSHTEWNLHSAL